MVNILFLHRNFPAQFRHVLMELKKGPNKIFFITNNDDIEIPGVEKIVYRLEKETDFSQNGYLNFYEDAVFHGKAVAEAAQKLKDEGFIPDVIYGHSWGPTMFIKDIFPNVPLICYFEWFYNAEGADADFGGKVLSFDERARLRTKISNICIDLVACDAGICPTNWQKQQFPKEFQEKIKVLHDGIDTDICRPNSDAVFIVEEKNLALTAKDEVLTYATRGMEAYRGFPQFMVAADKLLKKRPNLHVVIAGEDAAFYGPQLTDTTFKQMMLKELNLDMERVHFVGKLPYEDYIKLLQISSAHVYLTYPFVPSWSLLEAMSVGCCIVASDTEPVQEVVEGGFNGLLCNFFDFNQLAQRIEYVLDNQNDLIQIRNNARKTILENYALKDIMPKIIGEITHLQV